MLLVGPVVGKGTDDHLLPVGDWFIRENRIDGITNEFYFVHFEPPKMDKK